MSKKISMVARMHQLLIVTCGILPAVECMAADLQVEVRGLTGNGGQINVGLFNRAEDFPKTVHAGIRIPAGASPAIGTFTGLPPGDYAVVAYHDENGNGQLDRNPFGQPTEPYGFSRDARGRMAPPKFEDASVTLGNDNQTIIVDLH